MRNVVKCGNIALRNLQILSSIDLYYAREKCTTFWPKVVHFPILQHFATKLCNFTNFNTLFLAVVMDFVLLAEIKISLQLENIGWLQVLIFLLALSQSWAFSAVGSLEGQHCIVTEQLKSLDVKKLEQCCTSCLSVVDGFQYMISHNHAENSPVSSSNEVFENENCNFSTAAYGASLTGEY